MTLPARAGGKAVTVLQLLTLVACIVRSPHVRSIAWATTAVGLYAIWDYGRAAAGVNAQRWQGGRDAERVAGVAVGGNGARGGRGRGDRRPRGAGLPSPAGALGWGARHAVGSARVRSARRHRPVWKHTDGVRRHARRRQSPHESPSAPSVGRDRRVQRREKVTREPGRAPTAPPTGATRPPPSGGAGRPSAARPLPARSPESP